METGAKVCYKTSAAADSHFAGDHVSVLCHDAVSGQRCSASENGEYRHGAFRGGYGKSKDGTGAGQAVSYPVWCVAGKASPWRYGNQLYFRQGGFSCFSVQTSGNAAADSSFHCAYGGNLRPAGSAGGSEAESVYGLSYSSVRFLGNSMPNFLQHCCLCIFFPFV